MKNGREENPLILDVKSSIRRAPVRAAAMAPMCLLRWPVCGGTSSSWLLAPVFTMVAVFTALALGLLGGGGAHAELYTALVELEELLETEAVLMSELEGYIAAHEHKIRLLKRHLSEYVEKHEEASQDVQAYLSNPINSYLLVKRLTTDWKSVESQMVKDVGEGFVENITNYRAVLKFPTDEDLNGAAVALMRLQDTYKLDTASVARGELNGIQYSTELSAGDCFELGRQSFNNGDLNHTVLWMQEALHRYEGEYHKTSSKSDILEYLAYATYMEGNVSSALQLTQELLDIVPTHQRALENYEIYLQQLEARDDSGNREDGSRNMPAEGIKLTHPKVDTDVYKMLCRNEVSIPLAEKAKLKCRYTDLGNPYLRLARVKEEEAYLKPRIVIFHDVLYDSEIETIKKLAQPKFRRAGVQNFETGELEVANFRVSKSAFLKNEEHEHIRTIDQRVEDLTGLTMSTAEELQVLNYGIGGHYEPHCDFYGKDQHYPFEHAGNRIATILFYMSDVPQGGATVFPFLKVALWPRKGSAAFWYNLYQNGEGDFNSTHAACPVLVGTKWVFTKWIHEIGQEFRRPCGLNFSD